MALKPSPAGRYWFAIGTFVTSCGLQAFLVSTTGKTPDTLTSYFVSICIAVGAWFIRLGLEDP
jgi:hypothetical protein